MRKNGSEGSEGSDGSPAETAPPQAPDQRLTPEQVERVTQLVSDGMKMKLAVSQVLGEKEGS